MILCANRKPESAHIKHGAHAHLNRHQLKGSVGECPYWAAPLRAYNTLTYALITIVRGHLKSKIMYTEPDVIISLFLNESFTLIGAQKMCQ